MPEVHYTPISHSVSFAKQMTAEAAAVKDWRVRNKRSRALRELARKLNAGKGYIIASAADLQRKYPDLMRSPWSLKDTKVGLWCISFGFNYGPKDFQFLLIF